METMIPSTSIDVPSKSLLLERKAPKRNFKRRICSQEDWRTMYKPAPLKELHGPSHLLASELPEGFPPELAFRSLAAYSFLRTLSLELRLSPFTPNVFLRALNLPLPSRLLGQIHVALLRPLLASLNMGYTFRPRGGNLGVTKKRKVDGHRVELKAGDNLTFLDGTSWPLFFDDFTHLTADILSSKINDDENFVDFRTLALQFANLGNPDTSETKKTTTPAPHQNSRGSTKRRALLKHNGRRLPTQSRKKQQSKHRKFSKLDSDSEESERSDGSEYTEGVDSPNAEECDSIGSESPTPKRPGCYVVDLELTPASKSSEPEEQDLSSRKRLFRERTIPRLEFDGPRKKLRLQTPKYNRCSSNPIIDVDHSVEPPLFPRQTLERERLKSAAERLDSQVPFQYSTGYPSASSMPAPSIWGASVHSAHVHTNQPRSSDGYHARFRETRYNEHLDTRHEVGFEVARDIQALISGRRSENGGEVVEKASNPSGPGVPSTCSSTVHEASRSSSNEEQWTSQEKEGHRTGGPDCDAMDISDWAKAHFSPVELMRSGEPYHRLPLEEKLRILEFMIDELLEIDYISNEFARRESATAAYPSKIGVLPTEKEYDAMENADECSVCGLEGELLCCDGCPASYHRKCINLAANTQLPEGRWLCPECRLVDPSKYGSLLGGKKPALEWLTARDLMRPTSTLCDSETQDSFPRGTVSNESPEGAELGLRPSIEREKPSARLRPTNQSLGVHREKHPERKCQLWGKVGIEYLFVHGFVFAKSRSPKFDPSCNFAAALSTPRVCSQDQLYGALRGAEEASKQWPVCQIPFSPTKTWKTTSPIHCLDPVHAYFASPGTFDPTKYTNKYRQAPLPKVLKAGPGARQLNLVLSNFESECGPSETLRLSTVLEADMSCDRIICAVLRRGTSLFNPYRMAITYMVNLEANLRRSRLLEESWGLHDKTCRSDVWASNVKRCMSVTRLSKLLVMLVDKVHPLAFFDDWFSLSARSTRMKETEGNEEKRVFETLPTEWTVDFEKKKRRWEQCSPSNILSVLADEPDTLANDGISRASQSRKKRKFDTRRNVHVLQFMNGNQKRAKQNTTGTSDATIPTRNNEGQPNQTPTDKSKDTQDSVHVEDKNSRANGVSSNQSASAKTRRSGRLHKSSDFQDSVSNAGGSHKSINSGKELVRRAQDVLEHVKARKLVELQLALSQPIAKELHWPLAGRMLFDPAGYLPPKQMRRLGRNAGTVVAPYVTYTKSFEVGQTSMYHLWRKRGLNCVSLECLLTQVRILDSFIDKRMIGSCDAASRRYTGSKAGVQKVITCVQQDLGSGVTCYFVVNKTRGRGCWIPCTSVEPSSLSAWWESCVEDIKRKKQEKRKKEEARATENESASRGSLNCQILLEPLKRPPSSRDNIGLDSRNITPNQMATKLQIPGGMEILQYQPKEYDVLAVTQPGSYLSKTETPNPPKPKPIMTGTVDGWLGSSLQDEHIPSNLPKVPQQTSVSSAAVISTAASGQVAHPTHRSSVARTKSLGSAFGQHVSETQITHPVSLPLANPQGTNIGYYLPSSQPSLPLQPKEFGTVLQEPLMATQQHFLRQSTGDGFSQMFEIPQQIASTRAQPHLTQGRVHSGQNICLGATWYDPRSAYLCPNDAGSLHHAIPPTFELSTNRVFPTFGQVTPSQAVVPPVVPQQQQLYQAVPQAAANPMTLGHRSVFSPEPQPTGQDYLQDLEPRPLEEMTRPSPGSYNWR